METGWQGMSCDSPKTPHEGRKSNLTPAPKASQVDFPQPRGRADVSETCALRRDSSESPRDKLRGTRVLSPSAKFLLTGARAFGALADDDDE